ncbi:carbohydrate ABC transporter permease [Thiospirochaeta perfilievii]|uniref:Carbohydrate ABC transporter permease n=1 Tax=Thiospirochaeta perfilievii TaxID=252967 RepID=A0A5C1Q9G1_9SPIO|nr:carbohydrate ABC transporter permease [Thiospirochaeta perfilievii]QEN04121.1 carbohydrate ABC transporter permease [Thiospirochaeta perfilievii]
MTEKTSNIIFDSIKLFVLIFLLIITLYPFLNLLAISFNEAQDTAKGGITLFPRVFSTASYRTLFRLPELFTGFVNSVLRTVIGSVTQVFSCAMIAYVLSRKSFPLRKPLSLLWIFTMYVSGGLIPYYFLMRSLGLLNNFHIYWIPGLTSAFTIIVIRTYIIGLPESLIEAAKVEGAGEFRIFMQIILPLAIPVLATMALFAAVDHWNSWVDTWLFNPKKKELTTLQYELMKKLSSTNSSKAGKLGAAAKRGSRSGGTTPKSIRAAMTMIAAVPIMLVYPFLQKYFVTGLTLGGVKE